MLRYLTAGESHGRALVVIVEGLPAGLPVATEQVQASWPGGGSATAAGPRMRFEQDEVTIVGGVRHGLTLGSPVAIEVGNSEWDRDPDKWQQEMSVRAEDGPTQAPLTQVRPGHADLAGMQKYGLTDARDVLERASARETAARVAAGTRRQGAAGRARRRHREPRHPDGRRPLEGGRSAPAPPTCRRWTSRRCAASTPPPRTRWSPRSRRRPRTATASAGSSRCWPTACPSGLGSHVHWDRKLDALLARALMSIQAVKGVEIGDGFEVAGRRGSDAHDPITWDAASGAYRRESALAGGVEGGMSTGEVLVARAAMKPLATLNRPTLRTVDTATKEETVSFKERTDVTAVPAMGVVAETMVALVLADEATRKFGGDSVAELRRNRDAFVASLG